LYLQCLGINIFVVSAILISGLNCTQTKKKTVRTLWIREFKTMNKLILPAGPRGSWWNCCICHGSQGLYTLYVCSPEKQTYLVDMSQIKCGIRPEILSNCIFHNRVRNIKIFCDLNSMPIWLGSTQRKLRLENRNLKLFSPWILNQRFRLMCQLNTYIITAFNWCIKRSY
jgi:hypothetical protein